MMDPSFQTQNSEFGLNQQRSDPREWQLVAEIMDRFFLVLFLFLTITILSGYMLVGFYMLQNQNRTK